MEIVIVLLGIINLALCIYFLISLKRLSNLKDEVSASIKEELADIPNEIRQSKNEMNQHIDNSFTSYGKLVSEHQSRSFEMQDKRMAELTAVVDRKVSELNLTVEKRIGDLNGTVDKQLDQVRETVDEKLQKTLNDRITKSFELVNSRLEQVYKGLGEMQNLAQGVGDIKKVLANVKTRGILGEIQLKAILDEILVANQYEENVITKQGSRDRVEFAVKMPGEGEKGILLPIDSKFPGDTYAKLCDAYDGGDKMEIALAIKALEKTLKAEAKDIYEKYISPPDTTDFAIMFLPFEGLYAEAVRMGMVEKLQREYKVNIAGPTTMAALLNSLQMGFRTLAIQKSSSQVWEILGAVKAEFSKFEDALQKTRQKLQSVDTELEKLVVTRTNAINRKLRNVTELSSEEGTAILEAPKTEQSSDFEREDFI